MKGFRAMKNNVASDTGMKHGTKPSAKNILESRLYKRVRFRSCGSVGYGPTMWVKRRKGIDIFHGHDSNVCQRLACQSCWQQSLVPKARDEENHFPARWMRRTNRKSSRPSVVTGMSTAIITRSYRHFVHRGVFISRELLLLRSHKPQESLNKTMEKKRWSLD